MRLANNSNISPEKGDQIASQGYPIHLASTGFEIVICGNRLFVEGSRYIILHTS